MSTSRYMYEQGCHKVLPCRPHYTTLYINDTPLALFDDGTYLYATGRKAGYVLRNLQRALYSVKL
jgi:hypothetical protein